LGVTVATKGVRDCQVNVTPAIGADCASRASALAKTESPSEGNCGALGVMAMDPIRVRTAFGVLETPVGVPFTTAIAVTLLLPSRTPFTCPVCVTVERVVSEEVHWNVTPVTVVDPDIAAAVSWRVPLRITVE